MTTTTHFRLPAVFLAIAAMIASLLAASGPAFGAHDIFIELAPQDDPAYACTADDGPGSYQLDLNLETTGGIPTSPDPGQTVTVEYSTVADGSATANSDFQAASDTIVFEAGDNSDTITIDLVCDGDTNPEDFSIFLQADGAEFAEGGREAKVTVTIQPGKPPVDAGEFFFGVAPEVTEADGSTEVNLVFQVCLSEIPMLGAQVTASTLDGDPATTATAGSDYESAEQDLSWNPVTDSDGDCKEFEVPVINDDTAERAEEVVVGLSDNSSGTVITQQRQSGTIKDDDANRIHVRDNLMSEGDAADSGFAIPFEADVAVDGTYYIVWETADGTATSSGANADYTSTRDVTEISNADIASGSVPVNDDGDIERWHERFFVTIECIQTDSDTVCDDGDTPAEPTLGDGFEPMTIQDNEPEISITDASSGEGESMTFTVELSQFRTEDQFPSGDDEISVDYETVEGSATDGEDYEGTSGTLTWTDEDRDEGNLTKQVTVDAQQDGESEGSESFTLALSNAQFAGIGDSNPGVGTIIDDDAFDVDAGSAKSGESAVQVSFTAQADCPNDCTYTWDFGDGTADQTGKTVQHRFAETGTFTVTVTVEGSSGSNATDTTTATITDSGRIERSFGSNREGTAIDVSRDHWDQADTVLLATGYAHADALAAGPLAKKLDAPLLLTNPNGLPDEVKEELDRLDASKVIILGGVHAVPQEQADELAASGYQIQRIAGINRFGTAADIATEVGATSVNEVTIALGQHADENRDDWPDALSAGSFASLTEPLPSLLTHSSTVPQETMDALGELDTDRIFLLGGNVAISDTVEQQLEAEGYTVQRVFGADRYATSVAAGEIVMDRYPAGQVHPVLATGQKFPDGLTGGALAGKVRGPVVLVPTDTLDNASSVRDFLREHANPFDVGTIVGGEAVVSDNVQTQARSDIDTF